VTTQIHIQATGTDPAAGPRQIPRERGKRLRGEWEATYPGHYSWDYPHAGPGLWQVRIGKPARSHPRGHDGD
jgi:hypothetical protein